MTATKEAGHATLWDALLAFQAEAPALQKDKINPHFKSKYISLDTVTEQTVPLLNKHGLVWTTMPCRHENEPALTYRLIHAATGESVDGVMPLMVAKGDPQGQGSAITYARRYSLLAVLNLVADEDDDGNKASAKPKAPKKPVDAPGAAPVIARCQAAYDEIAALGDGKGREDFPLLQFEEYVQSSRHDIDRLIALENHLAQRFVEIAAKYPPKGNA